jgi:tight adherence protein B
MFLPILTLGIFVVTLAMVTGFLFFFVESPLSRRKMMTRLSALQEVAVRGEEISDVLRKDLMSDIPLLNRMLITTPGVRNLKLLFEQAAIKMQIGTFVIICIGSAVAGWLVASSMGFPSYFALGAGLLGGAAPFAVVYARRQRRFNTFEEQFPEALDLLGRAVRAGHAFTTGFELIGKELPDPVAEEFRIAFQQQGLGLPLKEALGNLAVRMPLPDVRIFVSCLTIQREAGGNLGELLDSMSHIVRERFKLRRQVQIYTAEGRLSMYMLTAIPVVAFLGLQVLQPEYIAPMLSDPRGQMALGVAVLLQAVGYVVISRIIRIRI